MHFRFGTRSGTRSGTRAGTRSGLRSGTRSGLRAGTRSRAGTRARARVGIRSGARTGAPSEEAGSARNEGGFALAVVVFLLFAIAVAAATGYRVVQTEARQSIYAADAAKALAIAHAGAERLIGEAPPDLSAPRTLEIDGGEALVTSYRVSESFPNEVRLLTSRGSFADPRFASIPARRVIRQYVEHRKAPLDILAAVMNSGPIALNSTGPPGLRFNLSGSDDGSCPGSPLGVPAGVQGVGATDLSIDWALLSDPAFPVDAEVTALPATVDDYPLTRVLGDLSSSGSVNGTGILIVTGAMVVSNSFQWRGIILVGGGIQMDFAGNASHQGVHGVLVGGLNGTSTLADLERGRLTYNRCEVLQAGARLARLSPLTNSWWEVH